MLVALWTDSLLWLLVVAVCGYFAYARRREHLLVPWRRVGRSAPAMVALVVLSTYLAIGLLDSIHYRPALQSSDAGGRTAYAVEVRSLLDDLLEGLRQRRERTYSAPFALESYQRETIDTGGRIERVFPRLRYGGAHLKSPEARVSDIAMTTVRGLILAFFGWLVAALCLAALVARRQRRTAVRTWADIWAGRTTVRWRAALFTLGALFALCFPVALLASGYHVLGTDKVGQDVLYLALKSVRTALVIGTVTTLVTLPLGVLLGISAGYFRGWVDDVIQYVYTTINSIPGVLLIAASVLMVQVYIESHPDLFPTTAQRADLRLLFLCIILGFTAWTGLARLLRGEALKLRQLEYIQAAHAFGVSHARTIVRHILPNVLHIVVISLVMEFSVLVLAEAVLSYIGVGVDPTMNSFGTMINTARLEMAREPMVWWSLSAAFAFMFVLVLAANLFADAVRDAFDPRTVVGGPVAIGTARSSA